MQEVFRAIGRPSQSNISVLINGESGTGKELVAHALHHHSPRRDKPFVPLNVAAIPKELVESELFGHEKGAFTGAHTAKPGRLELAANGTLFLDEITEISAASQAKLLTALDGEPYMRIGGVHPIQPGARIVTATNVSLEEAISSGKLRKDVYARLSDFVLHLIPLREHAEDIPLLAEHFNFNFCKKIDKDYEPVREQVLERMQSLQWQGNVRALAARVKEYVATDIESVLTAERAPEGGFKPPANLSEAQRSDSASAPMLPERKFTPLKEATRISVELTERALIEEALHYTLWNRRKAAKLLQISYSSLLRRIEAYSIGREQSADAHAPKGV